MVVRTKHELDERISQGWGITIKNGRYYIQRRMPGGRVVSEIIGKNLDNYASQLYEDIRGSTSKKTKKSIDKKEKKAEKMEEAIENELTKKTKSSVVKHLAQALDKRTQYLIQWGMWVEANILPRAEGDTWDEKAQNTIALLNTIKDSVPRVIELADENEKLRNQVRALKDMLRVMHDKINTVNMIKEMLNKAILNNANPQTIHALIEALVNYSRGNGGGKWQSLTQ